MSSRHTEWKLARLLTLPYRDVHDLVPCFLASPFCFSHPLFTSNLPTSFRSLLKCCFYRWLFIVLFIMIPPESLYMPLLSFLFLHSFYLPLIVYLLSCVWSFVSLWTIAHQAPLSMKFPKQEYWSQLPFYSSGEPCLLHCRWILYCWATREVPSPSSMFSWGSLSPSLESKHFEIGVLFCCCCCC